MTSQGSELVEDEAFSRLFGERRGLYRPAPAGSAAPARTRHGVFALNSASRWRIGGWHANYDEALAAYERMEGANYHGHRLCQSAGPRLVDVSLCVRAADDPTFASAAEVTLARVRVVRGGKPGPSGVSRGFRTQEGAARRYAASCGLSGTGGWFRARNGMGHPTGPIIAQGLADLARVADVHARQGGYFFSEAVAATANRREPGER